MPDIRYDDLNGLKEMISDDLCEWGPQIEVTQDMIQEFADITGDQQWIHVDVEKAKAGPFGAPIAHGLLTIALMPKVKPQLNFNVVGEDSRVDYGAESFRFLAPVPAGSILHGRMRLAAVREHHGGTLLTHELQVQVVGGKRPSLIYNGLLLYKSPAR